MPAVNQIITFAFNYLTLLFRANSMHRIIFWIAATSLIGCRAAQSPFLDDPIVDTRGVNQAQYQRDLVECQAYAEQVNVAGDVAVGAVTGAVVGGAVGAAVGNSDTAKRGAGAGAIVGGVREAGAGIREKERVVRRCLVGRGYRVLN